MLKYDRNVNNYNIYFRYLLIYSKIFDSSFKKISNWFSPFFLTSIDLIRQRHPTRLQDKSVQFSLSLRTGRRRR